MRSILSRLPNWGSLWILVATFGFAVMGALVKVNAQKFSSIELVFYRSFIGWLAVTGFVILTQRSVKSPVLKKHVSRSLVGLAALLLFFYALASLPLATAITLNYTSPLFLALLTPIFLKSEQVAMPIRKHLYLTLFAGFIGVIGLLHPTFDREDWLPGVLGLCSGVGAGLAYIHVKQLGQANEPDWRTVFYFTLISSIGSGILMMLAPITPWAWEDVCPLLGMGLSATIAQLALTRAYRTGSILIVASLSYTTLIFASLLGWMFWNETLTEGEILAILLIALSGIYSSQLAKKR